jgi:hypothetical protein
MRFSAREYSRKGYLRSIGVMAGFSDANRALEARREEVVDVMHP